MITQKKIREITNKIIRNYDPDKIILFGSYASGTAAEHSDIDLFIVKDTELPRIKRSLQIRLLLFGSKIPIDILVFTPQEVEKSVNIKYSITNEVMNKGKVLYEKKY